MSSSDSHPPLRVAVAGLGFGNAVHLPSWLDRPGVTVVGVASRRREKAEAVAREHRISFATDSIDRLLALGPDAVSIALPPDVTAEAARQALSRDIAVLCEKPIASTIADATMLAGLARHCITAVDFSFSELNTFQELRQRLASRELGVPVRADVVWRTESYAHRNRLWGWKTDRARFGGVVSSFASHVVHLVEWLFGPVIELEASLDDARTRPFAPADAMPAWDDAQILMRHRAGTQCGIRLCNAAAGEDIHEWTIVCEAGSYRLVKRGTGIMTGLTLLRSAGGTKDAVLTEDNHQDHAGGRTFPFRKLLDRFVHAVHTSEPCEPSFVHGYRVQYLMDRIEASAAAASSVTCNDNVQSP